MRFYLLIVFILATNFTNGQAFPGFMFGGNSNDIGTTLCKSHDDGLLVVGTTRSYGNGAEDIYLIMLDQHLVTLWEKTIGREHRDIIRSVIKINDGYLMFGEAWDIGMARSEIYLMKTSKDCEVLWEKSYGTHLNERGFAFIKSTNNFLYLLGYSRGYDSKGDILLIKTDTSGNQLWQNSIGFEYDDYGMDLIEDQYGNIVILGSKNGFFNDIHANYIEHDADFLLAKVNPQGQIIWKKYFGGVEHDFGYVIQNGGEENYFISGSTQTNSNGKFDMFLASIDTAANIIWQNNYGGENYDYCVAMINTVDNNLLLVGTSKSYGNSADIFVVKTDGLGEQIWSLTIGDDNIDYGNNILATDDGGCIVIGQSQNDEGVFNVALIKISSNGIIENITWQTETQVQKDISFGPNPMKEKGNFYYSGNDKLTVNITDINGQTVKSFNINQGSTGFNKENLKSGIYIFTIMNERNIVVSGKIIIQ